MESSASLFQEEIQHLESEIASTFSEIDQQLDNPAIMTSICEQYKSFPVTVVSNIQTAEQKVEHLIEKHAPSLPAPQPSEPECHTSSNQLEQNQLEVLNQQLTRMEERVDAIYKKIVENDAVTSNAYDRISILHRHIDLLQRLEKKNWKVTLPQIPEFLPPDRIQSIREMNTRV